MSTQNWDHTVVSFSIISPYFSSWWPVAQRNVGQGANRQSIILAFSKPYLPVATADIALYHEFTDVKSYIARIKLFHMCLFLPPLPPPCFEPPVPSQWGGKLLISWTATILINRGHRWSLCMWAVFHRPHQLFNDSDTRVHINSSPRSTKTPNILCELDFLCTSTCCSTAQTDTCTTCVYSLAKHLYITASRKMSVDFNRMWTCVSHHKLWVPHISFWSSVGGRCAADASVYSHEAHKLWLVREVYYSSW